MTEVEKELYRDKNGKLLGQCFVCRRQLVRPTTPINRIIPELEVRQSEINPSLCCECESSEHVVRMKYLRRKYESISSKS